MRLSGTGDPSRLEKTVGRRDAREAKSPPCLGRGLGGRNGELVWQNDGRLIGPNLPPFFVESEALAALAESEKAAETVMELKGRVG